MSVKELPSGDLALRAIRYDPDIVALVRAIAKSNFAYYSPPVEDLERAAAPCRGCPSTAADRGWKPCRSSSVVLDSATEAEPGPFRMGRLNRAEVRSVGSSRALTRAHSKTPIQAVNLRAQGGIGSAQRTKF